jgi:2-dehydro-3-deoxygluconokinase
MAGALDALRRPGTVVGFGEMLLRLAAPGREKLLQTPRLEVVVGGAEANVLVGMSCLGHRTRMASVVADNALGDAARTFLRGHGVDDRYIVQQSGRMGLYFLESGAGLRAAEVVYDRAGSSFALAEPDAINWDAALEGASLFHVSGVTPAIGEKAVAAIQSALAAASSKGVPVSFDGNFRASLWAAWNATPGPILRTLMAQADILFATHRDIALVLDRAFDGDGQQRRVAAAQAAFDAFPKLKIIASTARHVDAADQHRLSARADTRSESYEAAEINLPGIVDRIGAGDAFAAGLLHALRTSAAAEIDALLADVVETGLALAALKHTLPGDASLFSKRDLDLFRKGGRDVRR